MAERDPVELALGGLAGVLVVVIGYGWLTDATDAVMLAAAVLALVAVLLFAAARRMQTSGEGAPGD